MCIGTNVRPKFLTFLQETTQKHWLHIDPQPMIRVTMNNILHIDCKSKYDGRTSKATKNPRYIKKTSLLLKTPKQILKYLQLYFLS